VETGRQLARMEHDNFVNAVTFSPNGKYLATGSDDCTIRIWDVETGKQFARMEHDSVVNAVTFSHDGKYIATASYNTARMWLWRPEDMINEACSCLYRNFKQEEWQTYMGEEPYRKTCPELP